MVGRNDVLNALGKRHALTFGEFCARCRDCPDRGDSPDWRSLFVLLEAMQTDGDIIIERETAPDGRTRIASLELTEEAVGEAEALLDEGRELFGLFTEGKGTEDEL